MNNMNKRKQDDYVDYILANTLDYHDFIENNIIRIRHEFESSLQRSEPHIIDNNTLQSINDTIRLAISNSNTFQRLLAFNYNNPRFDSLGFINYRNYYEVRDENRRLSSITVDEIINSTQDNVPIFIENECGEDGDETCYVNISPAPIHTHNDYPSWQAALIHEVIHALTGSFDPDGHEERLGPTEILALSVASELNIIVQPYTNYNDDIRTENIRARNYRSLIGLFNQIPESGHQSLLQRIVDISSGRLRLADVPYPERNSTVLINSDELDNPLAIDDVLQSYDTEFILPDFDALGLPGASASINKYYANRYIVFKYGFHVNRWHLKKYNLLDIAQAFFKVKNKNQFYEYPISSWHNWYNSSSWNDVVIWGKKIAEGSDNNHTPYGYYFQDGSFCLGLTGADVIAYGEHDNWTSIAGGSWKKEHSGYILFDKNGYPAAISVSSLSYAASRQGWEYIYKDGQWEYKFCEKDVLYINDHFPGTTLSLDQNSIMFIHGKKHINRDL